MTFFVLSLTRDGAETPPKEEKEEHQDVIKGRGRGVQPGTHFTKVGGSSEGDHQSRGADITNEGF